MAHPIRDDGYIDAEFREIKDSPSALDPQPCPKCGKDYVAAFGCCYFCGWQMKTETQGCLQVLGLAVLVLAMFLR